MKTFAKLVFVFILAIVACYAGMKIQKAQDKQAEAQAKPETKPDQSSEKELVEFEGQPDHAQPIAEGWGQVKEKFARELIRGKFEVLRGPSFTSVDGKMKQLPKLTMYVTFVRKDGQLKMMAADIECPCKIGCYWGEKMVGTLEVQVPPASPLFCRDGRVLLQFNDENKDGKFQMNSTSDTFLNRK